MPANNYKLNQQKTDGSKLRPIGWSLGRGIRSQVQVEARVLQFLDG